MAETLNVESAGATMNLFEVRPQGTAKGAVIVLQEAFGITDHIKDVCTALADAGYVAVAPHLFHRTGDPIIGYDKMQEVVPHIMGLNAEGLTADLTATLDHLAAAGFTGKQVGIVGFCMGGTIAFFAGEKWPLGAAVTFYGGGITQGRFGLPGLFDIAPKLQTPWLGLYGDHDQSIPLTEVEILRKAASAAPVPTDVHRYGDADHGFHCTHRAQFHEPSSQDAWKRAIAWFDAHVGAN